MQRFITVLSFFYFLSCLGCANQGQFGTYTASDTSSVTISQGNISSDKGIYEDPLYYQNNAFNFLYFN